MFIIQVLINRNEFQNSVGGQFLSHLSSRFHITKNLWSNLT